MRFMNIWILYAALTGFYFSFYCPNSFAGSDFLQDFSLMRTASSSFDQGVLLQDVHDNNVKIIVLKGTFKQMGEQYGNLLKDDLHEFYDELYGKPNGVLYAKGLMAIGDTLYFLRYPADSHIRQLVDGVADGASFDKSAWQTTLLDHSLFFTLIASLKDKDQTKILKNYPKLLQSFKEYRKGKSFAQVIEPGCSFISYWSDNNPVVVGRNFDWFNKFVNIFSPHLTIAVFKPTEKDLNTRKPFNQVITIGYLGWLGTITAINNKGLFLELNSGLSSGGIFSKAGKPMIRPDREAYTAQLLDMMFTSNSLEQLQQKIMTTPSDASYFINIANHQEARSLEVIPYAIGKNKHNQSIYAKVRTPESDTFYGKQNLSNLLVATNTYRLEDWSTLLKDPYPKTSKTQSFERYDNLFDLGKSAKKQGAYNLKRMSNILNKSLNDKEKGVTEIAGKIELSNPDLTYYSVGYGFNNNQGGVLLVKQPNSASSSGVSPAMNWLTIPVTKLFNLNLKTINSALSPLNKLYVLLLKIVNYKMWY